MITTIKDFINESVKSLKAAYVIAKTAKVGDKVKCPSCSTEFKKQIINKHFVNQNLEQNVKTFIGIMLHQENEIIQHEYHQQVLDSWPNAMKNVKNVKILMTTKVGMHIKIIKIKDRINIRPFLMQFLILLNLSTI